MRFTVLLGIGLVASVAAAQDAPPPGGPGGGPGGPGPGGGGGPNRAERKLVERFDTDADGVLNASERAAAREAIKTEAAEGRGPRRFGGPMGGMGGEGEPAGPGRQVLPADVRSFDTPLYDPATLRTLFLWFDSDDWEAELSDFYNSDVEVPATLTVDGTEYEGVGVSFRGASSFFTVAPGSKRSLNISIDAANDDQRLYGYRTLNLLNSHADPSFLRTVLYFDAARDLGLAAPAANLVEVVINGESWGVFINAQQFDRVMVAEHFGDGKGARWKAPGSPNGRAGFEYLGDDPGPYRARYEIKSGDNDENWAALIRLCKVLNETPPESLEEALAPILDIDGALKFLALEMALVNMDGYWVRASDYCLYLDESGKFHIIPHDANETFMAGGGGGPGGGPGGGRRRGPPPDAAPPGERRPDQPRPGDDAGRPPGNPPGGGPGGPPGPGGPRGGGPGRAGGVTLDPLSGLDDATRPLRSRLLKIPALRARYLAHVKQIAERTLDWDVLGPRIAAYRALIESAVEADTRKLTSFDAFTAATSPDAPPVPAQNGAPPPEAAARGPGGRSSLREFAQRRRAYLLEHAEIKALGDRR